MARAIVTPELADTLRTLRIQNKIQAKNLATHIKKSPAYISKLESGNIQTIDTVELYEIIQFISGNTADQTELAEKIYASLKFKYSKKEIEEQLWFTNFDTVERQIPVPESLIDELNGLMERKQISLHQLLSRINANEALTEAENTNESLAYNQWYYLNGQVGQGSSIKIKMSEDQLQALLSKQSDVSPYVFVLCTALCILKIDRFDSQVNISPEDNEELMANAIDLLNAHKFFSIAEKDRLLQERQPQDEISDLLSSFDKDNINIINEIISGFQFASECNIKATNKQLKAFCENMHWDLGFMLRIISLDFKSLEKTSVSNKRNLIKEFEKALEEYAHLPDEQNKIEMY